MAEADSFTDRYPHGVLTEQEGGVPNDALNWGEATHVCRKHRQRERICIDAAGDEPGKAVGGEPMKPGYLVLVGILAGIIGGLLMVGARMQAAAALYRPALAQAAMTYHVGFALLIIGVVLALAGVIIMAARKPVA